MKRPHLSTALVTLLVAVLAACGADPIPSGPGTASLDIAGRRGECHSMGGCAYVAQLDGPSGLSEAGFVQARGRADLTLGAGFPPVLPEGDYRLAFELRFMSDAIFNEGPRDFGIGAKCAAGFGVGPGRSVITVRVTFAENTCSVAVASEQLATSRQPTADDT